MALHCNNTKFSSHEPYSNMPKAPNTCHNLMMPSYPLILASHSLLNTFPVLNLHPIVCLCNQHCMCTPI